MLRSQFESAPTRPASTRPSSASAPGMSASRSRGSGQSTSSTGRATCRRPGASALRGSSRTTAGRSSRSTTTPRRAATEGDETVTSVVERSSKTTEKGHQAPARRLYVAGGQQRTLRGMTADMDSWYEYQKALIIELESPSGDARTVLEYVSPPETAPDEEPAILFKSGTLVGDELFIVTQTEVMIYRVPSFERVAYVSLPMF